MKSTSNGHADPNRQVEGGLGRREFLVLTSSCAAATVAFGPNVFGDVFAAPRDLAVGAVSIDDIDARLTDASKINSADASFLRNAAKVTLAGIALADQNQRSIGFRPHYLVEGNDIPVDAWGFNRQSKSCGGPNEFVMPVDVEERLRFSLVVHNPKESWLKRHLMPESARPETQTPSLTLSLRNEPNAFNLARAYYVIVPLHDGASAPRWSDYALLKQNGHLVMHEMRGEVPQPLAREHFVLRVDYATGA